MREQQNKKTSCVPCAFDQTAIRVQSGPKLGSSCRAQCRGTSWEYIGLDDLTYPQQQWSLHSVSCGAGLIWISVPDNLDKTLSRFITMNPRIWNKRGHSASACFPDLLLFDNVAARPTPRGVATLEPKSLKGIRYPSIVWRAANSFIIPRVPEVCALGAGIYTKTCARSFFYTSDKVWSEPMKKLRVS